MLDGKKQFWLGCRQYTKALPNMHIAHARHKIRDSLIHNFSFLFRQASVATANIQAPLTALKSHNLTLHKFIQSEFNRELLGLASTPKNSNNPVYASTSSPLCVSSLLPRKQFGINNRKKCRNHRRSK